MSSPIAAHIRPAVEGDVDALAAIAGEVIRGAWTRAAIAAELARAHAVVLVAEAGAEVAGFIITWHVADEAEILLIAVRTDHQRSGVGSALLAEEERRARLAGVNTMHLEVRASNANARAFYLAHGFEESGVRKGYYRAGGEDAVLMRRPVLRG